MALAGGEPARSLRDLLAEAGCTYESFARLVTVIAGEAGVSVRPNRSSVAHWVAGRVPAPETRGFALEALTRRLGRRVKPEDLGWPGDAETDLGLTAAGDPLRTTSALAAADLARRRFLQTAAYSVAALAGPLAAEPHDGSSGPGAETYDALARGQAAYLDPSRLVGDADVAAVRRLTAAFTAADERLGGEHGRHTVVTYLAQDVMALCRGTFATNAVRSNMLSAAAQVAYLAGWKAHDAGLESLAQRYYLQGFALAGRADPGGHAAYLLRALAHHALDVGKPTRSVDLAEAAWRRSRGCVDARTRSLFALTLARAHAARGHSRMAGRWLIAGESLMGHPARGSSPVWAELKGPPEALLSSHTGKTFRAMGRHDLAEAQFTRTLARWDPGTHPRVHALAAHQVGAEQAAQGHLEQACRTWQGCVPALRGTGSARTRRALAEMRSAVAARPQVRTSPVRELLGLLAQSGRSA